ncbi:hypothetical protein EJ03DRAFT_120644 [Teratosphaeria nubilosa]|uniref:Uncharacterized protein n=1 Tax=Teratosphaeria nubilosa TaxID=161662 RepID=A0A6G1L643_9PEZI|nr:hypothetical protein EJ03DRAFT_120644 [Teratosphaeria nubilosa]
MVVGALTGRRSCPRPTHKPILTVIPPNNHHPHAQQLREYHPFVLVAVACGAIPLLLMKHSSSHTDRIVEQLSFLSGPVCCCPQSLYRRDDAPQHMTDRRAVISHLGSCRRASRRASFLVHSIVPTSTDY